MAAVFEVWDLSTGNLVGAYDSEREALGIVRRTLERHGRGSADSLALAREDDDGRSAALAQGPALAEWAERDEPPGRCAAG